MRESARASRLADGRRLHLQDGPIDLIVQAFGPAAEIDTAYAAATVRFGSILDELCSELTYLRQPSGKSGPPLRGAVAQRMAKAVRPYADRCFITPMAAVAGAVAEQIREAMLSAARLSRCYVNNGGDIALYLAPGESFSVGMVDRPDRPSLFGRLEIASELPVRGLATSGWRGRSFSRGIADAVTVLAKDAAGADAAATVVANAVDLPGHPGILRLPADQLAPDSDLGGQLVTRGVGALSAREIAEALRRGALLAGELIGEGLAFAAALHLQGASMVVPSAVRELPLNFREPESPAGRVSYA